MLTTVGIHFSGNNEIIECACICDVCISFKHPLAPRREGMSSYMEVSTDVRPEWPPFSGPKIHLTVYSFILKYMNPKDFHAFFYWSYLKLVYNVFLNRLLVAVLLKNGAYYMYVHLPVYAEDNMIGSPFHAAHIIYECEGSTFGRTSIPSPCPLSPSLPPRSQPRPRSVPSWPGKRSAPVYQSIHDNNVLSSSN